MTEKVQIVSIVSTAVIALTSIIVIAKSKGITIPIEINSKGSLGDDIQVKIG